MNLYEEIKDNAILDYETSKIVVYEESKFMYTNRLYVLNKWKEHAYHITTEEIVKKSPADEMGPSAVLYELSLKLC